MRETAQQPAAVRAHQPIPGFASLVTSGERLERMWKMTGQQRVDAARRGEFTLGEMLRWAARAATGDEVPLVDGEYFFIAALAE